MSLTAATASVRAAAARPLLRNNRNLLASLLQPSHHHTFHSSSSASASASSTSSFAAPRSSLPSRTLLRRAAFHTSSWTGAKKTPTGKVKTVNKDEAEDEEATQKLPEWQDEATLAKLATAPDGVAQNFWDLYRELDVRSTRPPPGQVALRPPESALDELFALTTNKKEHHYFLQILSAFAKLNHHKPRSYKSKILHRCLNEWNDPDEALHYLGDPLKYDFASDGSDYFRLLGVYADVMKAAAQKGDAAAEAAALDGLYLTLGVMRQYELIPNHTEQMAKAFKHVVAASLDSTLREAWYRAGVTIHAWERTMNWSYHETDYEPYNPDEPPKPRNIGTLYTADELAELTRELEKKGLTVTPKGCSWVKTQALDQKES